MFVTKRNGNLEELSFDKILNRIKKLGQEANININYQQLIMKVINQLCDKIPTTKIDELVSQQCASMSTIHPDYNTLASRIVVSNHQKNTISSFYLTMKQLYEFKDNNGIHKPLISDSFWRFVSSNSEELDKMIDCSRDYLFDYFGFKTLENAYLYKINDVVIERPQHMWMRVSVQIHGNINDTKSLEFIKETYDLMSLKNFTHATPTLYNSGSNRPQLSSCFLLAMESDSIEGIFNTVKDCAMISKYAGGIGLHIHNIRCKGSHIQSTNGKSDGLVPMLRVFNNTARYANQSGKRNGSFCMYLEPWHADIFDYLELKKNHGHDDTKARDLFYALWISDLFMERVKMEDGKWSLMCPNECKQLSDVFGDEFKQLYEKYESEGKVIKTIRARDLWLAILEAQMETGTPFMVYKDACNLKSNQMNIGTIKSSNLCTEIVEYSDDEETAVCNLGSVALPEFVDENLKVFDFDKLHQVTKVLTKNLNNVIDLNFYPTEKTKRSNMRHRPIGLGIQGLADVFMKMDVAFDSDEAKELNIQIFETIYHATLERSNEISIERGNEIRRLKNEGNREKLLQLVNEYEYSAVMKMSDDLLGAYSTFVGSPASKGLLQFDLWNVKPSNRYDWDLLKESIKRYGIRNSLLVALMPTASTSQILGYNECFEPFTTNIYSRKILAGDFVVVNKYLINDLLKLGCWNKETKDSIIENKGSVQHLTHLPQHIRNKYKTSWELSMKTVIDMAADRSPYICQSQSLNLWIENPVHSKLTSMHFYAWEKGLKTGMYYLRRRGKHQAQQFTIEPSKKEMQEEKEEVCESCSA